MMSDDFPLKQGGLDSLCSIYAIVNFLHLATGKTFNRENAWGVFQNGIAAIEEHAEAKRVKCAVQKYLLKGIKPKHMLWLFGEAVKNIPCAPNSIKRSEGACFALLPAIIYFTQASEPTSHYTVVKSLDQAGNLELCDSYGFDLIEQRGPEFLLPGNPDAKVEILWTWHF